MDNRFVIFTAGIPCPMFPRVTATAVLWFPDPPSQFCSPFVFTTLQIPFPASRFFSHSYKLPRGVGYGRKVAPCKAGCHNSFLHATRLAARACLSPHWHSPRRRDSSGGNTWPSAL